MHSTAGLGVMQVSLLSKAQETLNSLTIKLDIKVQKM
jgi:hypothetical protein